MPQPVSPEHRVNFGDAMATTGVVIPPGMGEVYETMDAARYPDVGIDDTPSSDLTSLEDALAPLVLLRSWAGACPTRFARDMAYGLLEAGFVAYESRDFDSLGEALVRWGATLQIEADRPLARRLRRQLREAQLSGSH